MVEFGCNDYNVIEFMLCSCLYFELHKNRRDLIEERVFEKKEEKTEER